MNERSPNLVAAIDLLERMQQAEGRRAITDDEYAAMERELLPELMQHLAYTEAEARAFFEGIRATRMYTRFESPIWMSRASELIGKIDAVLAGKESAGGHKKIVFGTLGTGDVNGMAVGSSNPEYQVIVLDDGVFGYVNLLSKATLMAFPLVEVSSDEVRIDFRRDRIRQRIGEDPSLFVHLADLILNYLVNGNVFAAERYFPPMSYVNFLGIWLDAMEYFVLGHEYGHCRLGHLEAAARQIPHGTYEEQAVSWQQEYEADAFGLKVMMDCMGESRDQLGLAYAAVETFFSGIELIGRSLAKFSDVEYADHGSLSHPPVATRRRALREALRAHLSAGEYRQAIAMADAVQDIVGIMAPRLEQEVMTQRAKGLKLHPKWLN